MNVPFNPPNLAFSNGSAVFGGAVPYLTSAVSSNINYQGFGAEWNINGAADGLNSATNTRGGGDPVPYLSPENWGANWNTVIQGQSFGISNHNFNGIYQYYVNPSPSSMLMTTSPTLRP